MIEKKQIFYFKYILLGVKQYFLFILFNKSIIIVI